MLRRILTILLAITCLAPIALLMLLGLERLLGALGDEAGASVLGRVSLAGAVCWALSLVGLVLVLALQALAPPDGRS
jgi:hypothetical protein